MSHKTWMFGLAAVFLGAALLPDSSLAAEPGQVIPVPQMTPAASSYPAPMQLYRITPQRDSQFAHWNGRLGPGCYWAPRAPHFHRSQFATSYRAN